MSLFDFVNEIIIEKDNSDSVGAQLMFCALSAVYFILSFLTISALVIASPIWVAPYLIYKWKKKGGDTE